MGLSRLENFLKSVRGTILYVDPNSLDSTDSIENSGNSLTRPFKTIQRALIEAARFSYQRGENNDRFNKTTIVLYPGDHLVDNRPGYIPTGAGVYSSRGGQTNISDLTQWDLDTRFDLSDSNNNLYKLNSIYGGVIVPRGTSIVGMDLRKTKIRPTYVPNPVNDNIERSSVFRVTGGCYFWQFTILDADPNGTCYKDYTFNKFVPNFSHHKLTGFEYADGVNGVDIDDDFLTYSTTRTDLDMYYEKVAAVYGVASGREIQPDYGSGTVDIQPVIDEYRIVGSKGESVGISSIRAGNGTVSSTTVTVNLSEPLAGLSVDSPIQIQGVGASGYDGQYVISTVSGQTQLTYKVENPPVNPLPSVSSASLSFVVDTVTSASPYIFNISLRSVYGMCGLLADGDKATGFKSMVVAQYTGIGLQKDDNAFVKYDSTTGDYKGFPLLTNLHTDSESRFKPEYENFHIKATNDSFLQLVSVFAIGYADHFITDNGGDIALNNSNSNFGAKALISKGFKRTAFEQDDHGYITHIIPPKEIETEEISIEFTSIDVGLTTSKSVGAATTNRLYLYNETDVNIPPKVVIDGYHLGAKQSDLLNVQLFQNGGITTYSSRIIMPSGEFDSTEYSSEKSFTVRRSSAGINSITANVITLTTPHSFINGESVRVISDNAHLPDGLTFNQVYYVSTVGITTNNQIKISKTFNDAINGTAIGINNKGGVLSIVSRVSDKNPGEIGHPVQWDVSGYWYVGVSTSNNQVYTAIRNSGVSGLGQATPRSYVTRKKDSRSLIDTLYRVRYVIPKNSSSTARPPVDGYILQESGNILGEGTTEISQLYNSSGSISNSTDLRNPRFIANISWSSNVGIATAEIPHDLNVGDEVEIVNVNPSGYNGTYEVLSVPSAKEFRYSLPGTSPGVFLNDTSNRNDSLPYFRRKKYNKTYQVYRTQEIQPYIQNFQDGVYYLTLINHSNYPTVTPFQELGFAQPISNLYPQINQDNPNSDPQSSKTHALSGTIGQVVIDDLQNSITKETLESFVVGTGITNITSSSGTAHTIYTSIDHGLSGITSVSIVSAGSAYGSGSSGQLYNAKLVGFAGSTTGSEATAKITINGSGAITAVKIIDGGSAYGIGNTLRVVGVATTTSHVVGVVRVETVSNNVGDSIKVIGVSSASYATYNNIYRVSSITTGKTKEINVVSSQTITNPVSSGIGAIVTSNAKVVPTGKTLSVSSLTYNSTVGLATITFTSAHGLKVDNKIRISGANQSVFNGDFIVKRVGTTTSLTAKIGVNTTSTSATGTIIAYRPVLTSYSGDLTSDTENVSGRLSYEYAGVTTSLSSQVLTNDPSLTNFDVSGAVSLGLDIGDYLLINDEIFRIRETVTSNNVKVFRSLFGTPRQTHDVGAIVRRIKVTPVEIRRNSIIRASGHTFEYLGFGPGNYSTSLPEKQNRGLTNQEKFLAQSTKIDGGIVVYTGMNSDGDFFAGNKKINSATGKEESYDTPVPTTTGEKDVDNLTNITDTQKLFVTSSLKVEGGRDKNIASQFDGPVILNSKLTSNSDIEANSLLLQGNEKISRKFSISSTKPTTVGNYGDIVYNSLPSSGASVGWTYTVGNEWSPFGWINNLSFGVGVSTNSGAVGFSTLINFTGTGLNITRVYDSTSGITTLNFNVVSASTLYATNAGFATNAGVANTSLLSYTSDYATNAGNSGYASVSGLATSATFASYASIAGIATYSNTSGIATFASTTGISSYSTSSGISTNVIGGIASVTSINASGISTIANLKVTPVGTGATVGGIGVTFVGEIDSTNLKTNSSGVVVTGVTTSTSFDGSGIIPIGGIIMWSGSITSVPNGWSLCNGTNGTPNLTNRFIVAAHNGSGTGTIQSTGPGFNASTGVLDFNYSPGNAGGSTAVGLTTAQLPPHNHTQSTRALRAWAGATGASGSPNSTGAQISDTLTTTDTGSGLYHENRPPYYALAFIMRIS